MTIATVKSIFKSFNARNLAPEQIAQTFVPPEHFASLVGQHHTLIVGPRGSGKTTLLKMLQQPALDAWQAEEAEGFRSQIGYISVYIGTDTSWGQQLACLGLDELKPEERSLLENASFTTHILKELVSEMDYFAIDRKSGERHMSPEIERDVAANLASIWKLEGSFGSLLSVKYSLASRLGDIHAIATRESLLDDDGTRERLAHDPILGLSFLPSCSAAVDVFNDAINEPRKRWALLFDELELAPKPIREYLLKSLRSVDDRILFKLSLVPFGDDVCQFQDALSAMPGQDFEVIPLWYGHKEEGYSFCRQLWTSMITARNMAEVSPEEVLGRSMFDTPPIDWKEFGTAYGPKSKLANRFKSLAVKDDSFKKFLTDHGINLNEMDKVSSDDRASKIRKATSIVAIRDALIRESKSEDGGSKTIMRSRKVPALYSGTESIFAITEGNPRWFKGIIGPMLDELSSGNQKVNPAVQTRIVAKATRRFRALLRTIPSPPLSGKQPARGLLTLLDEVGDFFHHMLVLDSFTLDPVGSFTVDSRVNDSMLRSLGMALNSGAIVNLDELDSEVPLSALRGKRFRLSYLLTPHYRTMIRLGRPLSLRVILGIKTYEDAPTLFEKDNA